MAFEEVVNFFDETTQALQFNQNLLFTSLENLSHGLSVVDKDRMGKPTCLQVSLTEYIG